jgi:hypothetical protein
VSEATFSVREIPVFPVSGRLLAKCISRNLGYMGFNKQKHNKISRHLLAYEESTYEHLAFTYITPKVNYGVNDGVKYGVCNSAVM